MDISVDLRKRKGLCSVDGFQVLKGPTPSGPREGPTRRRADGETLRGPRRIASDPGRGGFLWFFGLFCVNDPSAGSPTETLLRLLLPLDEQICMTLD